MKKKNKIIITVLILLPILLISSLYITNNCIANNVEKELLSVELPLTTKAVDSLSISGKMYGNGNGMQYIGSLLITSELSEEELNAYYQEFNSDIIVEKHSSPVVIEQIEKYKFDNFDETQSNYKVELVKYNPATFDSYNIKNFIWKILDWDLRGH